MDQIQPPTPAQRPRRRGAQRVERAAELAARERKAVFLPQPPAARRIIRRIGDGKIKASGRDLRVRLPKISADDRKPVCKTVPPRVFLRLPRRLRLDLDAADTSGRAASQQQKPQRPAAAAKIQPAPAGIPAEIRQHHRVGADAELRVWDRHADAAE